jgi:hyperosmotically inducible periplasmic protein
MRMTLLSAALLLSLPAFAATTPDGLITSKAKLSLWTTAGVRSTSVHVDTNDGMITLYGKVPTAEQKAIAEKTAREIMGARGVTNLLQVVAESQEKAVAVNDKDISNAATKLLNADASLKDSKITVKSVDKGLVLLSGEAKTFSDHLRAVAIVDRVPGVRRVASEVKSPDVFGNDERVTFVPAGKNAPAETRTNSSDMRMTAAVKLRLFTAAEIPSGEISVDTEDGVVMLFGIVPTAAVKAAAGAEARKVKGVVRVDDQLEVVATAQKKVVDAKDADITRDLALAVKDRTDFKTVTTLVKNGIVRISGTVGTGWDEVNVVRVVRLVSGVRGVEDQLKVDDSAPRD